MSARVAICDDSPLLRRVLRDVLTDGGFDVIAEFASGDDLLHALDDLAVDVITLDVEMPGRDGIQTLREIIRRRPMPVVMVSSLTARGAHASLAALGAGAVDVVEKPKMVGVGSDWELMCGMLRVTVAAAASATVRGPLLAQPPASLPAPVVGRRGPLVIIATSTGGPRALESVCTALPSPLGCGTLLVQHMPAGFTGTLAQRLDSCSALSVHEVTTPMAIRPTDALLAQAGSHLVVTEMGRAAPSDAPSVGRLRPRADIAIASAVEVYGRRVVLVVLTGMGSDGRDGARAVRDAGGIVICESEETCVVYGMPRAVIDAGLASTVAPLGDIPRAIVMACSGVRR